MRFLRTVVQFLAICVMTCELSHAQSLYSGEKFATGIYDEMGLVSWGDLSPLTPDQAKGLALLKQKRWPEAKLFFERLANKNPRDLHAHLGRIEAMRRVNRIPDLLLEMTKKMSDAKKNGRDLPVEFKLAYFYGYSLNHYLVQKQLGGVPMNKQPDERIFWMRPVDQELARSSLDDKLQKLLYVTSLSNLSRVSEARNASRIGLKTWPEFHMLRLILSNLYCIGTLARWDGRNRELPVPEEDKANYEAAFKEAEYVIKKAPNLTIAYYFGGFHACQIDKKKAANYLTIFIKRAPKGTPRYNFAVEILENLNRK